MTPDLIRIGFKFYFSETGSPGRFEIKADGDFLDLTLRKFRLLFAIVDIDEDWNTIQVDESETRGASSTGAQQQEGGIDVWAKIAFNLGARSDSGGTKHSAVSGGAQLKAGG
ncbi:hypothetical protein ACJZ2D_016079 [Fusarium nematophilum]